MGSKLSVEELLANLEERAAFHRDREAFHAHQEVHHREQRTIHAAELEKVQQNLEAFRTVASAAVELARPIPKPASAVVEPKLPAPGRLMVGRLLRLVIETSELQEPFNPTSVAAEANRRFKDRLSKPVGPRTASDILRRMLAEGRIQLVRQGKANHESLYRRNARA